MTLAISKTSLIYVCICDLPVALFIIAMPILAHLFPIPLYILEPMRLAVFATLILMPNRKMNAIMMALLLPLLSYIISGHPIAVKNILIAIELVANVTLFQLLVSKFNHVGFSMFASILTSKLFYYGMKYVCLSIGLLSINIISTPLIIQIIVSIVISLVFAIWYKK